MSVSRSRRSQLLALNKEIGILVLYGRIILFTSGEPGQLRVLSSVKDLAEQSNFVAHRVMAVTYSRASESEEQPSRQRSTLLRARAYAEAALHDFQQYQGRAAEDEARTQGLLDEINQALAKLPQ